jgi:hypothetical protein
MTPGEELTNRLLDVILSIRKDLDESGPVAVRRALEKLTDVVSVLVSECARKPIQNLGEP